MRETLDGQERERGTLDKRERDIGQERERGTLDKRERDIGQEREGGVVYCTWYMSIGGNSTEGYSSQERL